MKCDSPVVAEVRRARARILARFGYDLRKYGEYLMREQEKETNLIRAPKARRPSKTQTNEGRIDEAVTSSPAAKASVRKVRKDHAESKGVPLSEPKRRLGV